MRRCTGLAALGAALAALGMSYAAAEPLPRALLFFELNDTDGDLGIHGDFDAPDWAAFMIQDPGGRVILEVEPEARLARQGLTQLFFESAEPSFDELAPSQFFARFPEGDYAATVQLLEGGQLRSRMRVSHVLAAPAGNLRVNGVPAAESCDAEELPTVRPPVVITWSAVTTSHPDVGSSGPITVERYQLFAEQRVDGGHKYSLDLPPTARRYVVAPELIALGDMSYKFEIQVRATNGNQTATESCFNIRGR